ncbi:MAG: acetoacetate decarboxylase family protein [Spirochaetes bacterium]|nr:acetoacetate decarboxylase family protein [Spirochaetota bacterium]
MKGDLFKGIVQWDIRSELGKGKLPCFYYDTSAITAIFTASTRMIRRHLPGDDYHPLELLPGRCLVAFNAFEYRKTDIGPYNEFSIAVLVNFRKRSVPLFSLLRQYAARCYSAYVWHLPVTTEIARLAGVELYNYPKIIADIDFTRSDEHIQCTLSEKGVTILRLMGRVLKTGKGRVLRYRTHPVKDGIPLIANVITLPHRYAESSRGDSAVLEYNTSHPMGRELSEIGLGSRPLMYQYLPENEAILFAPRNIIDH